MNRIREGDRVRIDIPDKTDPDFEFHRETGEVVAVITDDAGIETGDPRDSAIYRVNLDDAGTRDFRWRDLRLPLDK